MSESFCSSAFAIEAAHSAFNRVLPIFKFSIVLLLCTTSASIFPPSMSNPLNETSKRLRRTFSLSPFAISFAARFRKLFQLMLSTSKVSFEPFFVHNLQNIEP